MKHDFGISVAVETISAPHEQQDLHVLLPVKWIWDPMFRYTPSYATDVRKTFERIRRELQSQNRDGFATAKAAPGKKVLRLDSRKSSLQPAMAIQRTGVKGPLLLGDPASHRTTTSHSTPATLEMLSQRLHSKHKLNTDSEGHQSVEAGAPGCPEVDRL